MAGEEDLQDSIYDLHQYLSDTKPPLMVADSVEFLLKYPPDFLAAQIHAWVATQNTTASVAEYLYHSARKISMLGDLDLLAKDVLKTSLQSLVGPLVTYCPEADRDTLRTNLERLAIAASLANKPAVDQVLHRQAGPQAAKPPAATDPATLSGDVRRLTLLLERLRPLAAMTGTPEQRTEIASQFITAAAVGATTARQLDENLAPLKQVGIEPTTDQAFRTLAGTLAGWALPAVAGQPAIATPEQLEAMRKLISLSTDPTEVAKRFREMVHAAVEQFNAGHLGRAAHMFELAEQLAAEQKVQPVFIEALRTKGHEYLDPERLRRYAERTDQRRQLKPILGFFAALQPAALLTGLDGEPKREKRHQLLALLEVHGAEARIAAWELLKAAVDGGVQTDPYLQGNLAYLLRILPRPADASVEEEVSVVTRAAGRDSPPPFVKQVIAYLAHVRHEKAERALYSYLKVFESMLTQPETAAYPERDVEMLLDRTCDALARYGTPRSWRLLIDHGLKVDARLGSPFLRLAEAGRVNLSSSPDVVARVIAAVRAELPRGGMLGGLMGKKDEEKAGSLIQALAGTPLPEVTELFQELARGHADRPIGAAAAKALASLASAGKPPHVTGFSGDLELFGLANLLQMVVQSELTGHLSVLDAEGKSRATLLFERGRFRGGECGHVLGEPAIYQLLEIPFPGTFAFVARTDIETHPRVRPPQDVFGIMLEGVRRYDEFRRAAAVVPDGAHLKATEKAFTLPEGEDAGFGAAVWKRVTAGKTSLECEASTTIDAYRIRRLVAHWVTEESLLLEN